MGKTKDEIGMLIVDPPVELVIEGPINQTACKKIHVSNPSRTSRVAFKLKTTTPRLFFVRPNVGVIMPEETVIIDIFVHPICPDQNVQRHKFLMQAAEANEPIEDLHEFWKNVLPASIWDTKIKVKLIEAKKADSIDSARRTPLVLNDGETMEGHQEKDNNDSLTKLMHQINELEEERQTYIQKVELLEKEKKDLTTISLQQQKWGRVTWCSFFALAFAIVIGCIVYNENYM